MFTTMFASGHQERRVNMARPTVLSNGRLLVGLNESGLVQDFYYPYVGQSNMTNARHVEHKIGVSIDGIFSWITDDGWESSYFYEENALAGHNLYKNDSLMISIDSISFADIYDDIYCRQFKVTNLSKDSRNIKLYFHQIFQISANGRADTAMYVPANHPYIHVYRGNTSFIIGLRSDDGSSFNNYAVGMYDQTATTGTFKDAEDDVLSGNTIEHGSVDSVISAERQISSLESIGIDYWVVASAVNYHEATKIHRSLALSGLSQNYKRTVSYWTNWLGKKQNTDGLNQDELKKINLSLMIIKAHIDERGGVLASSDSSIFNYGKDYYSYVWPRDAASSLAPLLRLGYVDEAMQYFRYIEKVMHPKGYVHHKYQPDGGIGSTWHPMLQNGRPELNIQEDETASTVLLFFQLKKICSEVDFIDDVYKSVVKPMLDFMASYMDNSAGLPHPSYDLWEEKFLTSTYTTLLVAKALELGATDNHPGLSASEREHWANSARIIRANFTKLFDSNSQHFSKGIRAKHPDTYDKDTVIDISTLFALFKYGGYTKDHIAVASTLKAVEEKLLNQSPSKGVIRYDNDVYMLSKEYPGNPWHVCTLWLAQCYAWAGRSVDANNLLEWTYSHCLNNGVMSEQIDPVDGSEIGVAPLVWSHAELINTLLDTKQGVQD